jgi:hypothetical protein
MIYDYHYSTDYVAAGGADVVGDAAAAGAAGAVEGGAAILGRNGRVPPPNRLRFAAIAASCSGVRFI